MERDLESFIREATEQVRGVLSEAEQRAAEIVRQAEAEAQSIRARAEREARARVEQARRALDELEHRLGSVESPSAESEAAPPAVDPIPAGLAPLVTEGRREPTPPATPEPSPPPTPEPVPPRIPEPQPPREPEPYPPPDEADWPSPEPKEDGDAAAARLVAMKMAFDGATREEIDRHLAEHYHLVDRSAFLEEVLKRAGR